MTTPPPGTDPSTDPPKPEPPAPPPTDKKDDADNTDWKAEAEKWKALSRKNEASAKKLQAIEDAQKTDLEKAQSRIAELEKESAGNAFKALQTSVGLSKKIPPALIDRLRGDTKEELEADADAMLQTLGIDPTKNNQGNGGAGRPQENLQTLIAGGQSNGQQMTDMNAFMRRQTPSQQTSPQ